MRFSCHGEPEKQWVGKVKARASGSEFREMAMKRKLMFVGYVLLLAVLGFVLDAGIVAMIVFHSADRTIVELRPNAR